VNRTSLIFAAFAAAHATYPEEWKRTRDWLNSYRRKKWATGYQSPSVPLNRRVSTFYRKAVELGPNGAIDWDS
jgi:hypothetical protein